MGNFVWTIISAIILGIGANLLTPYVSQFLGKYSNSIRNKNREKKDVFEKSVQYILEYPLEEINLRIGVLASNITFLLSYCFAVIFAGLSAGFLIFTPISIYVENLNNIKIFDYFFSFACVLLSLSLYVLGMYSFRKYLKYIKLVKEAWIFRRKKFDKIDID